MMPHAVLLDRHERADQQVLELQLPLARCRMLEKHAVDAGDRRDSPFCMQSSC